MLQKWTFERGTEQVVLQREDDARGDCSLAVTTSGGTRTFQFDTNEARAAFQSDMESFLLATGWLLASFEPERRQRERRTFPREHPDRRRWWTDGVRLRIAKSAFHFDEF
jgi:hypothetical protein